MSYIEEMNVESKQIRYNDFGKILQMILNRKKLQEKYSGAIPLDIAYEIIRKELQIPLSIGKYQNYLKRMDEERNIDLSLINDPAFAKGKKTVWKTDRGYIGYIQLR